MAVLSFPRSTFCEMYLGDVLGWLDISTQVRQTSPITIKRGASGEQGRAAPDSMKAVLHNNSGDWIIDNPMGAHFGQLGRNNPTRWGIDLTGDAFGDNATNSWGTADNGETWERSQGVASDYQVTGGKATQSIGTTNAFRLSYIDDNLYRDVEVRVTCSVLLGTNVTGGSIEIANAVVRGTGTDYYMARAVINTDQTISICIHRATTGQLSTPVTISGLVHGSNDITVAIIAEEHTIKAKAWDDAGPEPLEWQTSVHDTGLPNAGYVGVRSGVASGNTNTKPIVFSYDNFRVRQVRLCGELADLSPSWDESHTDNTSVMDVAGVLRRFSNNKAILPTVIETYLTTGPVQPIAYWPLDEGPGSTQCREVIGDTSQAIIDTSLATTFGLSPVSIFGEGKLGPGIGNSLSMRQRAILRCKFPDGAAPGFIIHACLAWDGGVAGSTDPTDELTINHINGTTWQLLFDSFARTIRVLSPALDATLTFDSSVGTPNPFDGDQHTLYWSVKQNGANADVTLLVDGFGYLTSGVGTLVTPINAEFIAVNDRVIARSIGHLAIFAASSTPTPIQLHLASVGRPGERAGARITRLCLENGWALDHIGDSSHSPPMGPQRPLSLPDLVYECIDVDYGSMLCDSRSTSALLYRPARYMTSAPGASVSYSAGQVARPLVPKPDGLNAVNDWTVKRLNGTEYRAVQSTGPLNVNDPGEDPNAIGRVSKSATVNIDTDAHLLNAAGQRLRLGTVQQTRYPKVRVNLASPSITTAVGLSCLDSNIGDRLSVVNAQLAKIYTDLDLLSRGYTETMVDQRQHEISFNSAPYEIQRGLVWGDVDSRWDSYDHELDADIDDDDVSVSVGFVLRRWTTEVAQFPMNIIVGGELMTLTAVTGTTSPQTFTVTRSVNGVVKSHAAGTSVRLAKPVYLGMI